MRVCVLGSGSKGNCTYIECGDTKVLVDAGLSCAQIEKRLQTIGINPFSISAILVTHEHSDHIAGAPQFAQKFGTKIFTHKDTWNAMYQKFDKLPSTSLVEISEGDFSINDVFVNAFSVSHDAAHCMGFSVQHNKSRISLATDLGIMTDKIKNIQEEAKTNLSEQQINDLDVLIKNFSPK